MQRADLDESAGDGGQAVSDGGRRDRGGFDREDRVSGYHSGAGAGFGVSRGAGPAEGRKAWQGREYLSGAVSLRAAGKSSKLREQSSERPLGPLAISD